ncbi:MAG: RNA polymerase sigma factor [Acidimicrobiales bacterium]
MSDPIDRDFSLVGRAADGDRAAFDELWHEYQPRLLRYLSSLGLRDGDDVAAQTWMEAFQALGSLDDRPGSFRRLLFTIARRRMVDETRRRTRYVEAQPPDEVAASAEFEVMEVGAALELLACLPPAQAEVLALRVVGGFSASEVGEITGQTEGAVRVMAHRALSTLRADMATESSEPYVRTE